MSGTKGILGEKGTTGLTVLMTRDDRANLARMVELVNHVLCTRVSQASIIRRAMGRRMPPGFENQLADLALAAGDDGGLGQS